MRSTDILHATPSWLHWVTTGNAPKGLNRHGWRGCQLFSSKKYSKLEADRPHPKNYLHKPSAYRLKHKILGLVMVTHCSKLEATRMLTDRWMDERKYTVPFLHGAKRSIKKCTGSALNGMRFYRKGSLLKQTLMPRAEIWFSQKAGYRKGWN